MAEIVETMRETIIRRIGRSEGGMLGEVRLRALETDPGSFGSTYAREAAFEESVWAERAARSSVGDEIATYIAISDGQAVGIVTVSRDAQGQGAFVVTGMWVAPDARRAGVGRRLLGEAERWSNALGGTDIRLSVAETATAARRLYESAGYQAEGESETASSARRIGLRKRL